MITEKTDYQGYFPTWCPGCGNFGIWAAVKMALKELGLPPEKVAAVFGVGCSGNMNDFLWVNSIHGLHGRAVPTAIGIKIANHKLPVIVIAGDGDCYGEGGNHLIHACRGNHDITLIIHDNRVYGLTTGQVAPTAFQGFVAKSTPKGIIETPLNPVALSLISGATYIAQGFSGEINHLAGLIRGAITHKGFSLVNVLQPCVTFNKQTTYEWYRKRVYKLENNYQPSNYQKALEKARELEEKIPIGIIYKEERLCYTDHLPQLTESILVEKPLETNIEKYIEEFL